MVTSVAIGRITMAAGARCMNLGIEGRVREANRVRTDKRFCWCGRREVVQSKATEPHWMLAGLPLPA